MAKAGDRRDTFEDALRRRLDAAALAPGPECLDPEVLAALYERTLAGAELTRSETHLADCARCQAALAALARADAPVARESSWWALAWTPGWRIAVPALAAALVIALSVARMRTNVAVAPPEQLASARTEVHAIQEAAPAKREGAPAAPAAKAESRASRPQRRASMAKEKATIREPFASSARPSAGVPTVTNAIVAESAPAAAGSPPASAIGAAPAGAQGQLGAQAPSTMARSAPASSAPASGAALGGIAGMAIQSPQEFIVRAPDGVARWHVRTGDQVDYTPDGVNVYGSSTGVAAPLVAGSAPTASVCWMVGRAGTVIRTTDGTHWTRLASPTVADLTRITAENADTASVTDVSGRSYTTSDGGRTWSPK